MIDRGELLEVAGDIGLRPDVVEKDYVLGWLLAGISAHPSLGNTWVFKGGTCLKKCYFETYRFSEDLDFTVENEAQLDEGLLRTALGESPFEKGFPLGLRGDSSWVCGPQRAVAGWPMLSARRSGTRRI